MLDLIESGVFNVYIKLISTWWHLSRIPIGAFGNALRCTCIIGCLSSVMQSLTEIYERNFEISWNFCKMGINYVMNLRPDFMQTNLLLFGCFHKGFTAHLFCKWPLCTLYNRLNASSDFGKHKGMWIKVKCSADLFSYFLRLLSQKRD